MSSADLREYYTRDKPFGPISSADIKDPEVFEHFFNKRNLLTREMSRHPSLIVGRRGAGKTAFLQSVSLAPEYVVVANLPPPQPFREVVTAIEEMSTGVVFVEETSNIWKVVLWGALFIEMLNSEKCRRLGGLEKVQQYVSGLGIQPQSTFNIVTENVIQILKERGGTHPLAWIADFIDRFPINNIVFREAQDTALQFLANNNIRAIILLDNLEDFQLDSETQGHSISGLLKAQAGFCSPGSPAEIRCCLPAELYYEFMHLSSNPNYDFQHRLVLHWHAGELMQLAAERYNQYLQLYHPDIHAAKFQHLDLRKRSDTRKFWNEVLPPEITNRLSGTEDSIAYILRHTQLLPRQLLLYLNNIASKSGNPISFHPQVVRDGIYEMEHIICGEIFSAFKYVHSGAEKACQAIRYLPRHFSDGDLHRVFNRHGGRIQGVDDYHDFKALLLEIGAVGRVTKVTDRYVEGLFEYTVPHRLVTTTDDRLCVHPVFSRIFRAQEPDDNKQPIYPFGCDIEGEEYRDVR